MMIMPNDDSLSNSGKNSGVHCIRWVADCSHAGVHAHQLLASKSQAMFFLFSSLSWLLIKNQN